MFPSEKERLVMSLSSKNRTSPWCSSARVLFLGLSTTMGFGASFRELRYSGVITSGLAPDLSTREMSSSMDAPSACSLFSSWRAAGWRLRLDLRNLARISFSSIKERVPPLVFLSFSGSVGELHLGEPEGGEGLEPGVFLQDVPHPRR